MVEQSKIQWCDHTFNGWIGCSKVSPGCANCYAERSTPARTFNVRWGKDQSRHLTGDDYWKQPYRWNRKAEKDGIRTKVFCASLSDWLDDEVPIIWLQELLTLVFQTPYLNWQLLTKRPQNFHTRLQNMIQFAPKSCAGVNAAAWLSGTWLPDNVWIGTTAENQAMANERIPLLIDIPAKVRFLSCEPLLEKVNLFALNSPIGDPLIHWVIVGGESGSKARPCDAAWMRSIVQQCQDSDVSIFVKQMGSNFADSDCPDWDYKISDKKGGVFEEFSPDLQVRQFPTLSEVTIGGDRD
jgi:protein gp37